MERRDFLKILGSFGALGLLSGCGAGGLGARPRVQPELDQGITVANLARRAPSASVSPAPAPVVPPSTGMLSMVPRSYWQAAAPIGSRLNRMGHITRVTVHHEGCPKTNWNTTPDSVAKNLRQIQAAHRQRMHAGDIGYHYIIDRAGRIWEGRSLAYQGAHVRGHNPGNIGIMCLGNFDLQTPSAAQLASLQQLIGTVCAHYRIPAMRVAGHADLVATRCPGANLRNKIHGLKGQLASL